jgi:hypothetical protein
VHPDGHHPEAGVSDAARRCLRRARLPSNLRRTARRRWR